MDVLSGLPNRGRVRQLLGEALSGSAGGETPCAIMFLDLDGFKPVNDTFGHPKGDAVLKSVAQRLLKEVGAVRPCRPDGRRRIRHRHQGRAAAARMVETLAERLIAAIAEPFHIDKAEIRIGVSIGCAFGPVDGQSVDDLIQKADLALYQAKARAAAPAASSTPTCRTRPRTGCGSSRTCAPASRPSSSACSTSR